MAFRQEKPVITRMFHQSPTKSLIPETSSRSECSACSRTSSPCKVRGLCLYSRFAPYPRYQSQTALAGFSLRLGLKLEGDPGH